MLWEGSDHWRLEGTVLTLIETEPAELRYVLTCDRSWRTRRCTVHVDRPNATGQIDLGVDETGSWFQNGMRIDGSGGTSDVDMAFSPSTNTIPIRRLALATGEEVRISVVWLRFPEFDAAVSEQVYARIAEDRYRFESGDFRAVLETDEHGIVTRYGDLWREIRHRGRRAWFTHTYTEGLLRNLHVENEVEAWVSYHMRRGRSRDCR